MHIFETSDWLSWAYLFSKKVSKFLKHYIIYIYIYIYIIEQHTAAAAKVAAAVAAAESRPTWPKAPWPSRPSVPPGWAGRGAAAATAAAAALCCYIYILCYMCVFIYIYIYIYICIYTYPKHMFEQRCRNIILNILIYTWNLHWIS